MGGLGNGSLQNLTLVTTRWINSEHLVSKFVEMVMFSVPNVI